jgi:hypothetical protein
MKLDVLSNFRERLSSPLIFSFLLSWLLFNWKVTVALLWYDPAPKSLGHLSLINFIEKETSDLRSITLPICFAVAYTLLSPVINNLISAFKTWNSKWGGNWNLDILNGSKVPIDKYLTLRKNYVKRTKELEDIITSENITQQKLSEINTALLNERNDKIKLNTELGDLKSIVGGLSNVSIMEGNWIRRVKEALGESREEKLQIMNGGSVYTWADNTMEQTFMIQNFIYDQTRKKISFVLWDIKKSQFYSFNDLSYEHGDLVGFEYILSNRNSITYRRPPNELPAGTLIEESTTKR